MPRLLLRREPPPDRRELELVRRLLRLLELRLLPELELDRRERELLLLDQPPLPLPRLR